MSNKDSNPFNGNWLKSQQQFLDAWLAFGEFMTNTNPVKNSKDSNPMNSAMDSWWKLVAPSLPKGSNEFISKMMEQGRFFNILGEQFTKLLSGISELNKATSDWQSVLNEQFDELKKLYATQQGEAREAMHGMLGAWQLLPMDTLQRTFSTASIMPGDFLEDVKPDVLQKVTDKFLSIPGVGYTREAQEQMQEGIRLWNIYQKTCQEYNNAMNKVGIIALDAMRLKIIKMAEEGKDIHSLREIYDLWVDCSENTYAEYVFSEEFSELYGRLTNALMAVKHHGRNYVDEVLSAFNMPTRRGINTMQKRQQDMRREQKKTEKIIRELQQQIAALETSSGKKENSVKTKKQEKEDRNIAKGSKEKKSKKKTTAKKASKNKTGKKSGKKSNTIVIKI